MEAREVGASVLVSMQLSFTGAGKCWAEMEETDHEMLPLWGMSLRGIAATECRSVRGMRAKPNQNVLACKAKYFASGRSWRGGGRRRWWWLGAGPDAAALLSFSFPLSLSGLCSCRSWPSLYLVCLLWRTGERDCLDERTTEVERIHMLIPP